MEMMKTETKQRVHKLKTWPSHYSEVIAGAKKFEARRNDRDYAVGDLLWLKEWDPSRHADLASPGAFTGRECKAEVTSILHGGRWGIEIGHCVMSIALVEEEPRAEGGAG